MTAFHIFLLLVLAPFAVVVDLGLLLVAWPACHRWVAPTAAQWCALASIGLLATAGQLAMTYAYKYTGAAYGSLLSLLTPVMSAAIGVTYFGEAPGTGFYVGSLLVLVACAYLSFDPVRRPQAAIETGATSP